MSETNSLAHAYLPMRRPTQIHVHISAVVHPVVSVLAAGASGLVALSTSVAGAAAVSPGGTRGVRRTGTDSRNYLTAGAHFERAAEGVAHNSSAGDPPLVDRTGLPPCRCQRFYSWLTDSRMTWPTIARLRGLSLSMVSCGV